ncbi:hypothetical protein LCGC14_3071430, partial [marine sediment metagenome]
MSHKKTKRNLILIAIVFASTLILVQGVLAYAGINLEIPTEPPEIIPTLLVSSSTHPDSSIYYSNNNPSFNWVYESGSEVNGYSFTFDKSALTEPDTSILQGITEKSYTGLDDGTYYFHLKAIDIDGVESETVHFKINIDTSPPV